MRTQPVQSIDADCGDFYFYPFGIGRVHCSVDSLSSATAAVAAAFVVNNNGLIKITFNLFYIYIYFILFHFKSRFFSYRVSPSSHLSHNKLCLIIMNSGRGGRRDKEKCPIRIDADRLGAIGHKDTTRSARHFVLILNLFNLFISFLSPFSLKFRVREPMAAVALYENREKASSDSEMVNVENANRKIPPMHETISNRFRSLLPSSSLCFFVRIDLCCHVQVQCRGLFVQRIEWTIGVRARREIT